MQPIDTARAYVYLKPLVHKDVIQVRPPGLSQILTHGSRTLFECTTSNTTSNPTSYIYQNW